MCINSPCQRHTGSRWEKQKCAQLYQKVWLWRCACASLGGVLYLVLELGDLPLAGCVVLHVVQHDLGVSQQSLGSLQVLPQTLLCLNVAMSHLGSRQRLGKVAGQTWNLLHISSGCFQWFGRGRRAPPLLWGTRAAALCVTSLWQYKLKQPLDPQWDERLLVLGSLFGAVIYLHSPFLNEFLTLFNKCKQSNLCLSLLHFYLHYTDIPVFF